MSTPESLLCRNGATPVSAAAVLRFAGSAVDSLGGNLVGIYVYGSLARGCFHPATSDVDILVLTREPAGAEARRAVGSAAYASDVPLDVLFIATSCITAEASGADAVLKPGGDEAGRVRPVTTERPDLLIDRQDAHECGVALFGPPAAEAVPPVLWGALSGGLRWLFPHIVPHFKDPVLMLCRITHALIERRLASKAEAGAWARDTLDPGWRPLAEHALADYASGTAGVRPTPEDLRAFEAYCRGRVST